MSDGGKCACFVILLNELITLMKTSQHAYLRPEFVE